MSLPLKKPLPAKLTDLTMAEAIEGLRAKKFSATELTQEHIAAVEKARPLNAFVTETPDLALEQAKQSDVRLAKGNARTMDGIPIAHKDMYCTKGVRTTASSKMLENFVPTYESTVSQKLLDAGAVTVGKVTLDEFAMGASNQTSHFGPCVNPWNRGDGKKLVPGGSSGGSAAVVAARCAMAATGTDTAGSSRQPAALCGVVGSKPSYGRASRWGIIAFASSLDQAGPLTRTVRDNAIITREICGYDPKDSTSANRPVADFEKALTGDIKGLKIGLPKECLVDGMNEDLKKLWQSRAKELEKQGAILKEVSFPHFKYSVPIYYILAPAEASSNLARYDGVRYTYRAKDPKDIVDLYERSRAEGFGREVRRRMLVGAFVLSSSHFDAYFTQAQKIRRLLTVEMETALKEVDVLFTPTAPGPAFPIGEKFANPIDLYLEDLFTVPANHAGLPAISVPAGLSSNNLPLGLQFIGRRWDEETMFRAADALERVCEFNHRPQFVAAEQ